MNKMNEQDIAKVITKYYASANSVRPMDYFENNLVRLCENTLNDNQLQAKWNLFKDKASKYLINYTELTFDTELINNAPSFRYGLGIFNDTSKLTALSFYISLIMPFFGWYFIDREKYPKDGLKEKISLGPTKNQFYKFGLEIEYDKLSNGEIQSVVDIDLPPSTLIDFLNPSPRFHCMNSEEKNICEFLSQQASQIFDGYEYLDIEVGSLEAVHLVPKSELTHKHYTYFDCLFTGNLTYL